MQIGHSGGSREVLHWVDESKPRTGDGTVHNSSLTRTCHRLCATSQAPVEKGLHALQTARFDLDLRIYEQDLLDRDMATRSSQKRVYSAQIGRSAP